MSSEVLVAVLGLVGATLISARQTHNWQRGVAIFLALTCVVLLLVGLGTIQVRGGLTSYLYMVIFGGFCVLSLTISDNITGRVATFVAGSFLPPMLVQIGFLRDGVLGQLFR